MYSLEQYIDKKNQLQSIFNRPAIAIPTNSEECRQHFKNLVCDLEPENLYCDGEASPSQVRAKLRNISFVWDDLEEVSGHEVSQDEAWNF